MEATRPTRNDCYCFGPYRLDRAEMRLYRGSEVVALQRKALQLLLLLVEDAGHLKSREELIEALWPKNIVEEQGLGTRIHALRRALGDDSGTPRYIETVRGVGYRFIAPVSSAEPAPDASAPRPDDEAPAWSHRKTAIGAAALIVLVVAGFLVWHFGRWDGAGEANATTPSIAVLPFENLSADPANAYFAAGVQGEILTRLASIGAIKVISRNSTTGYPSRPVNLPVIAKQLGVTTVLEGSVQKAGDEVHINVQLINAKSQDHIWAHSYNRALTDVFEVEGEVAEKIATALRTKLLPKEMVQITRVPTRDPQAYDLFLKANYYAKRTFNLGNVKNPANSVQQAATLYRQATARDPHFALAWARLSMLESWAWWYDIGASATRIASARKAAKRALALDPKLPQAHMAMGYAAYYGLKNYSLALAQFEQSRGSLPNNADIIAAIAFIHRRQGQWQQALEELRHAAILDPRNPRRHYEIGVTLTVLRRYAKAEDQFNEALAIEPNDYVTLTYKIRLLFLAGKIREAQRDLAAIPKDVNPQGAFYALRFESAWLARKPDRALAALVSAPTWILGMNTLSDIPTNLLRAKAWAFEGNGKRARDAYTDARTKLLAALQAQPDDPPLNDALGVTEAGLGEKKQAIQAGIRATKLLPISKDAFYGAVHLATLARIYAQTHDTAAAVKLLHRLLSMPAGGVISVPLLRLDPTWDPIRHDPRFQDLLEQFGHSVSAAPAADTAP